MTDIELIRLVHRMRAAQRNFHAAQLDRERSRMLREAKNLERLVGAALRERAPDMDDVAQFEGVAGAKAVNEELAELASEASAAASQEAGGE